jgi:hypothetical protein
MTSALSPSRKREATQHFRPWTSYRTKSASLHSKRADLGALACISGQEPRSRLLAASTENCQKRRGAFQIPGGRTGERVAEGLRIRADVVWSVG